MSVSSAGRKTMDKMDCFGKGSFLQHGTENNRVYLMKQHPDDFPVIIAHVEKLATENSYTKLFCKVPGWAAPTYQANGFRTEAVIPRFYSGRESAFFMAKYLDNSRLLDVDPKLYIKLSELLNAKVQSKELPTLPSGFSARMLNENDIPQITSIYKQVFKTYPFPIFEPDYVLQTVRQGVVYFGVEYNKQLVALSSAEVDAKAANAEMTDFATLPDFMGKKFSTILLNEMEKQMKKQDIFTAYTIARLASIPMNSTFLRLGYTYSGTLINNTNISGSIESMNVWYKHL